VIATAGGAQYLSIPDDAAFSPGADMALVWRGSLAHGAVTQVLMAQDEGGGAGHNKWFLGYIQADIGAPGGSQGRFVLYIEHSSGDNNQWPPSNPFTVTADQLLTVVCIKTGDSYAYRIYDATGTLLESGSPTGDTYTAVAMAAPLAIGWAEGGFGLAGKTSMVRVYPVAITTALADDIAANPWASELVVAGAIAGTSTLAITGAAGLTVSAGSLGGAAALTIAASADLTRAPILLAGGAALTITASVDTLAAPTAQLAARTGLLIMASGALQTDGGVTKLLRTDPIQRPFGRLERVA
jgi:hypothetical protein